MNENLLRRIKNQLNAKFYVMNDAWLRDCIEFFIRDKVPHQMTDRHIFEFVEGQWQLSDLREISNENGCLPRNLIQQKHTVLTGNYILQVDKMYDIASSKYKQLCEIRKINSENLEVTEKEKFEKTEWEPKAKRMIQLCLTDGVQDVTAIEYTPLKRITNTFLPGYKVMIIGPVDCRRGVILLEEGKYKEIGGEVESLLKSNALENILARVLGEPENPDPYNDNGPSRVLNKNVQSTASNLSNRDSLFDDDFEQAIDLEAVLAIERRSQEMIEVDVQNRFESIHDQRQIEEERNETIEETLEDVNFEPLENWPSDPSTRSLKALSASRLEIDDEDDIIVVEEAPTSARDSGSKPSPSASSLRNESTSEFPDDDFNFDDCMVVTKPEKSESQQNKNLLNNRTGTDIMQSISKSRLTNCDIKTKVKKHIPIEPATAQSKKSMASTSRIVEETPNPKRILDFFKPPPSSKICDTLSDVLRESITGKMYRTVRGQVKNHSALTKQGKCWILTALIADHTSNVEVCFDSEVLERFLGFTVQEFSQKKKLAKSNPQINNELRLSLRKAQHQIQNLDALLKLELIQGQTPKVVDITQLTPQQKEALTKKPL